MAVVKVLLDGEPLNEIQNFRWGFTDGVLPLTAVIPVTIAQAQKILASARGKAGSANPFLTLTMIGQKGLGTETHSFNNVLVTGYSPTNFEPLKFVNLHISDNRYYWNYGFFDASFNVRTKVGDFDSIDEINYPVLATIPRETYSKSSYRTYSLNPPVRTTTGTEAQTWWNLSQIIQEMLVGTSAQSLKSMIAPFPVSMDLNSGALKKTDIQKFEGIVLRGDHASCLSQVLKYIPSIGIYVDYNGVIRFYDKANSGEEGVLESIGTPQTISGVPRFVKHDLIRPRKYHVMFDSECEVRFDYEETGSEGSQVVGQKEGRTLINVWAVPDVQLDVEITKEDGNTVTIKAFQGQYLPFDAVLKAINRKYSDMNITYENILRSYMFPGFLEQYKFRGRVKHQTAPWDKIIESLKGHFRRVFRINGNWQSKMINISDKRATIFDPTDGANVPSPVYQDYAYWMTTKAIIAGWSVNSDDVKVFQNVKTWTPQNAQYDITTESIDTDPVPVPYAKVSMADAENGIFTVDLQSFDPMGWIKGKIFPGLIDNPPIYDYMEKNQPHYVDEPSSDGKVPALRQSHRMATILSAMPAQNVVSAYYTVEVVPEDIDPSIIPSSKLSSSIGPDRWIKIPPHDNATAKIRWVDRKAELVEQLFGIGQQIPKFPDNLKTSIVNRQQLKEYALAVVTASYYKQIDRYKGEKASEFSGPVFPNGAVSAIFHNVDTTGHPFTSVKIDDEIQVPKPENLLDPSVKEFLYRQIKGGGV